MLEPEAYEAQFKRLRNLWGWLLLGGWIALWYWYLDVRFNGNDQDFGERLLGGAGFAFGIVIVIITSPAMFVVSHYLARWRVDRIRRADLALVHARQQQEEERRNAEVANLRRASDAEASEAERAAERQQLILGFADIDAQLKVLEGEQDELRRTRALLNLTQYVASLYAKLPAEKIRRTLGADPALAKMIDNSLLRMHALSLDNEGFFVLLSETIAPTRVVSVDVAELTGAAPQSV